MADAEGEITRVLATYERAVRAQDGLGACRVLAPSRIEASFDSVDDCGSWLDGLLAEPDPVTDEEMVVDRVEVEGDVATVHLRHGGPVSVVREAGRWYVDLPLDG